MAGALRGARLAVAVVLTLVACSATAFLVIVLAPPLAGSQGVWLAVERLDEPVGLDLELDPEEVEAWAPALADALRRAGDEGEGSVTGTGPIDEALAYLRRADGSHDSRFTVGFEGRAYAVALRTG